VRLDGVRDTAYANAAALEAGAAAAAPHGHRGNAN
jgi:hypothetical protein